MTSLKLYKTMLERDECLKEYGGYTELNNGERFALSEHSSLGPVFEGCVIIFGYEYCRHLAETNYTQQTVDSIIRSQLTFSSISQFSTFGGYVNAQGRTIEEKGMMLVYHPKVSPVSLGAIAHKIAEAFRQESVLVIYHQEAQFVYV